MNSSIDVDSILKAINASLKSRKLYPAGHPAIITPVRKTFALLTDMLRTDEHFALGMVNEGLVADERPVMDAEVSYPEIMACLKEFNLDAMIFERGVQDKEIVSLLDILCSPPRQGQDLQNEVSAKRILHITLKSVPAGKKNIMEIYNGAVDIVVSAMNEVRLGKIPKSEPVKNIVGDITQSVLDDSNAMIGLAMIKNYDNYLYNHSVNVSILALSLGKSMKLSDDELHALGIGGLLHDIGKTGVSEKIIRKPSSLSTEEWDKLKEHPLLGYNIIKRMDGLSNDVCRFVFEHHIKYDNTGYPQTASKIHPLSQIISICDTYDALTTLRVYQKPHSPAEAIKTIMSLSGRHFNPDLVRVFTNMLGVYPVGTMVRLSTGEACMVTKVLPEAPDKPVVKVLFDNAGAVVAEHSEVDLSVATDGRQILSVINPAAFNINPGEFFKKEAETAAAATAPSAG